MTTWTKRSLLQRFTATVVGLLLLGIVAVSVTIQGRHKNNTGITTTTTITNNNNNNSWAQVGQTLNAATLREDGVPLGWLGDKVLLAKESLTLVASAETCSRVKEKEYYGCVVVQQFDESTKKWTSKGDILVGTDIDFRFGLDVTTTASGDLLVISAAVVDEIRDWRFPGGVWFYRWNEGIGQYEIEKGPLYGDRSGAFYGMSLSISGDGTKLAIGVPGDSRVELWTKSGSSDWNVTNVQGPGDFGIYVSMSDSGAVAIGSSHDHLVRILQFQESSSSWEQVGGDIIPDDEVKDNRALTISKDGRIVAIGTPWHDNGMGPGKVQVYRLERGDDGEDMWLPMGQILRGIQGRSDYFGSSVALSGDGMTLVVGAMQSLYIHPGYIKMFRFDEEDQSWRDDPDIPQDPMASGAIGGSLALSDDGSVLAVSSPRPQSELNYIKVFRKDNAIEKNTVVAAETTI